MGNNYKEVSPKEQEIKGNAEASAPCRKSDFIQEIIFNHLDEPKVRAEKNPILAYYNTLWILRYIIYCVVVGRSKNSALLDRPVPVYLFIVGIDIIFLIVTLISAH